VVLAIEKGYLFGGKIPKTMLVLAKVLRGQLEGN
jgi:hypothetical protein